MKYVPEGREQIKSANLISQQRYLFAVLSSYYIEFVKQFGMKGKAAYILQCNSSSVPGSGNWLSDFIDGKNPYLGPGNESCIEVIEGKMF